MRKLAVSLSKGGVGKSTTAVNLAHGLALAGAKVLLIDTDTQGQLSPMLGLTPEAGLAEVVTGERGLQDAILQARDNLWLLAGGRALAGVKQTASQGGQGSEQTVSKALAPVKGYDFVILDTAPGWDALTINVLFYADEILTPVSLEGLSLHGLLEFTQSVASIQKYRPHLTLKYILPTFMDGRVRKSDEILEQLKAHYGPLVCQPVHYSVRLSESPAYGQTIFEYAPISTGASDYQKLARRISKP